MTVRFRPAQITRGVIKVYWDDKLKRTFRLKAKWPTFWQTVVTTNHFKFFFAEYFFFKIKNILE